MSKSDAERGAAYKAERDRMLRYLDHRIPELQAEGKAKGSGGDPTRIRKNLKASKFPGVLARMRAEQEFHVMTRGELV